ncbi:MAG: 50S ribosomal protein L21 [Pseudomonadota bacterium]
MFAVIKTGGKQYRVARNDEITIEKLSGEDGEAVAFDEVLMIAEGDDVTVGAPRVAGAVVAGEVVKHTRGEKVYNFKKRRRKHSSKRLKGHRQDLTVVRITDIARG